MNFTGIDFTLVPDNSSAYIAFDLQYGFRLLEERRDTNAVYFRDLADPDADGISNSAVTQQGLIIKSSLVSYNGALGPLESRVGELIKIGDTWATVLLYNSNRSVVVDNYPTKLPPIQSIENNFINVPLHGLTDNTPIQFSGATPPIGITEGVTYYVRNPTINSFNISATSGGSIITLVDRAGELHVSRLYSVFTPTLDYDVIKDTIIGKVIRTGTFYDVETFYNVSGASISSFELVEALPAFGDYEGQVVLFENTFYTWNGISWATSTGTSSRTVSLSVTQQAFDYTSNGNKVGTPTSTVTATAFGTTGTLSYVFKLDGSVVTGSGNTYTYTPSPTFVTMPDIVTVDLYEDGLLVASDLITMFGVIEGGDAITVILSNEAHTVPTNSSGGSPDFTGSGTTVKVFRGNTPLNFVAGGTTSSFDVSVSNGPTVSGSTSVTGTGTATATVGDLTGISAATGFRDITVTVYFDGATSTFSKVQSFSRSLAGAAGATAQYVLVSGEQAFKYPSGSSTAAPATITLTASLFGGLSGFQWSYLVGGTPTNISGATNATLVVDPTNATYFGAGINSRTFRCTSGSQFDEITIVKLFDGTNSITSILNNESHTIPTDAAGANGVYTGSGTTIRLFEGITALTYEDGAGFSSTNGRFRIVVSSSLITPGAISGNGTTTATTAVASNMDTASDVASITFTLNITTLTGQQVTISKIQSFSKAKRGVDGTGSDGIVIDLSNENVTVAANSDGTSPNLASAVTQVFIYEGTANTTGSWSITATPSTGVTGTLSGTTYTVTGFTVDSGTVTFTATRAGYANQTVVFSISKARAGVNGTTPIIYEVLSSVNAVAKNAAGAYTPTTVTFSGFSTTGSANPVAYSGRFIVSTSTDGTNYTTRYTSGANESSYTYTLIANITFVRVELYLAGGTTVLLDRETIPIISDGATGSNGLNNAVAYLYQRSATAPVTAPAGTFTYTFVTGALSGGTLNGYSFTIPASNGNPLWVVAASASSSSATDSILGSEFSAPVALASDGLAGLNSATVYLYQRAASAPAVPSVNVTYTFSTSIATNQNNGWTQTIPAGSNPIWVTTATAASTTATDTIATGEWAAPVILAQNGASGPAGLNNAVVSLFNKNTSAVTPPTAFTGTATYTFATGAVTDLTFQGWTTSVPAIATGEYLWVRQAVASSNTATDTIAIGEWSAAVVLSNGGINGLNTTPLFLYNKNTSAVTAPTAFTGTATYTFATNSLTDLTLNGWTRTAPSLSAGEYLWLRQAVASSNTATDTIAIGEWSAAVVVGVAGTTGGTGPTGPTGSQALIAYAIGSSNYAFTGSTVVLGAATSPPANAAIVYNFNGALEGFTASGGSSVTSTSSTLIWTAGTADSNLFSPSLGIPGASISKIRMRVRPTTANLAWEGIVYYATPGHGYSGSFYGVIPAPASPLVINTYYIVEVDMSNLGPNGGTDWVNNTINSIRFDISNDASTWEIDWIALGSNFAGTMPASGDWGLTTSWTPTPQTLTTNGTSLYQVTGIHNPTTNTSTWTGYPYLSNLKVGQLSAITADVGTVTAGMVRNSANSMQVDLNNGRIVFNNGTVMKVTGNGFGSTNQFLEWFGPSQAISSCTEANGIQWVKTNGSAYFGGALSIGVLTTKAATTSTATNAAAETAVFGSNGGTITVSASWVTGYELFYYSGSNLANNSGSSTVVATLRRSINGGAYADVSSIILTRSWSRVNEGFEPGLGYAIADQAGASGSITYTDPANLAQNRQYKLEITSYPLGGSPFSINTQQLSIVCSEG